MSKVTYIISDFSFLVLQGLRAVVEELEQTEVILESSESDKIMLELKKNQPDFMIINPQVFSKENWLEFISDYTKDCKSKLIALLHPEDEEMETDIFHEILYLSDSKARILKKLTDLNEKVRKERPEQTKADLSEREQDILRHIALGLTNKEIAERLFLSPHTVVTHRKNITHKLGIKTVSGLTIYAVLNGLIAMNDLDEID